MRELTNKEWKKLQKLVKEVDENSTKNGLGVSFYTVEFFITENGIKNINGRGL